MINDYDYWGDDEIDNEFSELNGSCQDGVHMLISDDDGHWYVINEEEKDNFNDWVDATVRGVYSPFDFDIYRINNPQDIRFVHYWEEE
jgi:hypothetical protein